MKYIPLIAVAFLLVACNPGQGITCPELKQYPPEFLEQVAIEVEQSLDTSPGMVRMLKDYGVTRNAIRVCLSNKDTTR